MVGVEYLDSNLVPELSCVLLRLEGVIRPEETLKHLLQGEEKMVEEVSSLSNKY